VPRQTSDAWREDVSLRKSVSLKLGLSAVLQVNEEILQERQRLLRLSLDDLADPDRIWLEQLMTRYGVGTSGDSPNEQHLAELNLRVDALPPSLVMAQGAIESGWLQSRFAREGQAIFGQWTTSKTGIKARRSEVRLKAFANPRESLVAYMQNLNTNRAYSELRKKRAEMRRTGQLVDGHTLAAHVSKYAETGQVYVDLIRSIIRREGLARADTAKLGPGPRILFRQPE
jgi:Bax protein